MKQHRSAASARQARWRWSTPLVRTEMYLSREAVEQIDALLRKHNAGGRADVVMGLLTGAILPPQLVDVHRELLRVYKLLLKSNLRRRYLPQDVDKVMGNAIRRLEQLGARPVDGPGGGEEQPKAPAEPTGSRPGG